MTENKKTLFYVYLKIYMYVYEYINNLNKFMPLGVIMLPQGPQTSKNICFRKGNPPFELLITGVQQDRHPRLAVASQNLKVKHYS